MFFEEFSSAVLLPSSLTGCTQLFHKKWVKRTYTTLAKYDGYSRVMYISRLKTLEISNLFAQKWLWQKYTSFSEMLMIVARQQNMNGFNVEITVATAA